MAANDLVTETSIDSLSAAIAARYNTLKGNVGSLASLTTTDKSSIVAAINELDASSGGGATNLTTSRDGTTVTVLSDTGTDAVLPAADGSNAGVMTTAMQTKLAGIEAAADVTDAGNVATAVQSGALKATPVSGDLIAILDSEAANILKRLTVGDLTTSVLSAAGAGAPALLNTIDEIAAALGDDPNAITSINTALSNRLRVDTAAQGLNGTQQSNALTNLGVARSVSDFAAAFNAATA